MRSIDAADVSLSSSKNIQRLQPRRRNRFPVLQVSAAVHHRVSGVGLRRSGPAPARTSRRASVVCLASPSTRGTAVCELSHSKRDDDNELESICHEGAGHCEPLKRSSAPQARLMFEGRDGDSPSHARRVLGRKSARPIRTSDLSASSLEELALRSETSGAKGECSESRCIPIPQTQQSNDAHVDMRISAR
jgi:hypothetical protein